MFLEIYQEHGCDFYQVPMEMYSPAKVLIINQRTGRRFKAGEFKLDVLAKISLIFQFTTRNNESFFVISRNNSQFVKPNNLGGQCIMET